MHKKIEAELVSLAHSILQMENNADVDALHKKAQDMVDKLALLKFVNEYINSTPTATETKEEKVSTEVIEEQVAVNENDETTIEAGVVSISEYQVVEEPGDNEDSKQFNIDEVFANEPVFERRVEEEKVSDKTEPQNEAVFERKAEEVENKAVPHIETVFERFVKPDEIKKEEVEEIVFEKKAEIKEVEEVKNESDNSFVKKETLSHEQLESLFNSNDEVEKDDVRDIADVQLTVVEGDELAKMDTTVNDIPVFEKAPIEEAPIEEAVIEVKESVMPKSLNDVVFTQNLQVGLNDRIAFVKHLFNGSQEDFNRVLSQLNSFKSGEEAASFITDFVKLDYNWDTKEEYEIRLLQLVERKFL